MIVSQASSLVPACNETLSKASKLVTLRHMRHHLASKGKGLDMCTPCSLDLSKQKHCAKAAVTLTLRRRLRLSFLARRELLCKVCAASHDVLWVLLLVGFPIFSCLFRSCWDLRLVGSGVCSVLRNRAWMSALFIMRCMSVVSKPHHVKGAPDCSC